ncbi:YccF domain-containing protein [Georgenia sp. H159]|uniref:YccF domain-containing protein n=1 Tax=Georgenia sp. H159 TaxID=3076115 RepID=UPI002D777749|nr:YccF domain-containing protein [Georgenia sp. H159]
MRTIGNVLWLLLAGWWLALLYVVAGVIACVLIITIPFGIASFRLAGFVLWPFGRRAEFRRDAGVLALIGNILWILVLGWELALAHVVAGLVLCVTIVGIPLGVACWKMVPLALLPLGQRIVPTRGGTQYSAIAGPVRRG